MHQKSPKPKRFYITTPLYYPSGNPHLGHAYSTILADCLAKYHRFLKEEVYFLVGIDEHGEKIAKKAQELNLEPQIYVTQMGMVFVDLWKKLEIHYDKFARTTTLSHKNTVSKIFSFFLEKKMLYLGTWHGYYCLNCEESYTEKNIKQVDDQKCCSHGHLLVERAEKSYFFKMSCFHNWIRDYLTQQERFLLPIHRVNELKNSFLTEKLEDLSVTRINFSWGIQVKEATDHVIYVWLDALFCYLTSLGYNQADDSLFQKFWAGPETMKVHVIGKEISRFHCLYWPIFLHVLGVKLPNQILSHGWIITQEGKMSKSLGNVIDPFMIIEKYGADRLRFYLLHEIYYDNDCIFDIHNLIDLTNHYLSNNYGNLLKRLGGILFKYYAGKFPPLAVCIFDDLLTTVIQELERLSGQIPALINNYQIPQLIDAIFVFVFQANKLIENYQPWKLTKTNPQLMNGLLNVLMSISVFMIITLQPVLTVVTTRRALEALNLATKEIQLSDFLCLKKLFGYFEHHQINEPVVLFERLEKSL